MYCLYNTIRYDNMRKCQHYITIQHLIVGGRDIGQQQHTHTHTHTHTQTHTHTHTHTHTLSKPIGPLFVSYNVYDC